MSDQFNNGNPLRTAAAPATLSRGVPAVSLNLGALTSSVAAPLLNVRGAAAAGEGFAAMGQGIAKAGDAMGRLAEIKADHINKSAILDAEAKMSEGKDAIAVRLLNEAASPGKWRTIAEEEAGKIESGILSSELSPDAREHIALRLKVWKSQTLSQTEISSATQARKNYTASLGKIAMQFEDSGNAPAAHKIYDQMESEGLIGADQAEANRQAATRQAEAKLEDEQAAVLYDEASADPRAFLEKYKERPKGMKPALHSRMVNFAQQADREQVAADVDSLENAVVTGQLTVPAEVDEWQKDNPRITPAMREAVRSHLIRRNDATAKANIEANAPEIASQLYSEVRAFDWQKDGEEKYWKLRLRINELPAPIAGEVSGPLEAKFPGRASKIKPASESVELVEKTLDSMLERGAFGKNASGKADLSELFPQVQKGAYTAEFPMEKERALKLKAETGGKIRRWLDANPDATPEQAQKKLYEIVQDGTRAGMFDLFDSPAKIEPAKPGMDATPGDPKNNEDLPSNPGPADNILLPFPQQ